MAFTEKTAVFSGIRSNSSAHLARSSIIGRSGFNLEEHAQSMNE